MFSIFILIFSLNFVQILGEKCICVPIYECDKEDLGSYEHTSYWNHIGYPCKSNKDVCCNIKCGQRQNDNIPLSALRKRLMGNENQADFGEFPWMLAILQNNKYRCGGSLIHPRVALTAAHCVAKKSTYKLRAGEWDRGNKNEPLKHQDRLSKKIIIHPLYNPKSLVNDIALIILDQAFQLTGNVGVVCLPPPSSQPTQEECVVSGWGKTSHKSLRHQNILNKATLPIVPHSVCQRSLQRAHLGPMFMLDRTFMCAGGGEKDACEGDGGSPLVCEADDEDGAYEQHGIVSWGLICDVIDAPGVYTQVSNFVEWIDGQMKIHDFDTGVYKRE